MLVIAHPQSVIPNNDPILQQFIDNKKNVKSFSNSNSSISSHNDSQNLNHSALQQHPDDNLPGGGVELLVRLPLEVSTARVLIDISQKKLISLVI